MPCEIGLPRAASFSPRGPEMSNPPNVAVVRRLSGLRNQTRRDLPADRRGREIAVPQTRDGRHYSLSTVRFIPDGCEIPIHVGNYFLHQPVSQPLVELVDTAVQIS